MSDGDSGNATHDEDRSEAANARIGARVPGGGREGAAHGGDRSDVLNAAASGPLRRQSVSDGASERNVGRGRPIPRRPNGLDDNLRRALTRRNNTARRTVANWPANRHPERARLGNRVFGTEISNICV